jgi:hypothetical protein
MGRREQNISLRANAQLWITAIAEVKGQIAEVVLNWQFSVPGGQRFAPRAMAPAGDNKTHIARAGTTKAQHN